MANMTNALISLDPKISQQGESSHVFHQIQPPTLKIEEVENKDDKVVVELEDEDYTLEEIENMDNPAMAFMARKFKKIKFKKNKPYRTVSTQGSTGLFKQGYWWKLWWWI